MNAVAIGAHRRLTVAASDRLAMNALHEFLLHGLVTLRAGDRHVELEDRRLGIAGSENLVRAVAVGTHGSLIRSSGDCPAMHALLVGGEGLRAVAAGFHHKFLTVTAAAGRGDVCV